jgi:hypothetical protein
MTAVSRRASSQSNRADEQQLVFAIAALAFDQAGLFVGVHGFITLPHLAQMSRTTSDVLSRIQTWLQVSG